MDPKPTIDRLIQRAKVLSAGRIKNKGRPRSVMIQNEAEVVSKMRRSGYSINSIHRVMLENNMTGYKSYPKFKAAYINHKLHS